MQTTGSVSTPISSGAERAARATSLWGDAFRRFKSNRVAAISAVFILVLALLAVLAPFISPFGYAQQNYSAVNASPSLTHPFGTDQLGRDLLSRLLYGARPSLLVAAGATLGAIFSLLVVVVLVARALRATGVIRDYRPRRAARRSTPQASPDPSPGEPEAARSALPPQGTSAA